MESSDTKSGCTVIGAGLDKKLAEITPPKKIPKTKNKFHTSFRQLYLKKGILVGRHAAQICLSDELIPKDLLPNINNAGTVSPMSGPATYQGQGDLMSSKISIILFFLDKNEIIC